MTVAVASFTARGAGLSKKLVQSLVGAGHSAVHTPISDGGLAGWTSRHFPTCDALVFVGAAGIAVRAVAPHLHSKLTDPAVVSVDEHGQYAIPLVSGHIGGANELARLVAEYCGGVAVISTATDRNGVFAVDTWAAGQGLRIVNPARIKRVSGTLLAGQSIVFASDRPITGRPPQGVLLDPHCKCPDVAITCRGGASDSALVLAPPVLTVGIGCRRGVDEAAIRGLFEQVFRAHHLLPQAVRAAATIDRKADEPGLLAFCEHMGLQLHVYTAEQLRAVPGTFTPSTFVSSVTGVDNVCERAAALAGGGSAPCDEVVLVRKQSRDGVTLAVAESPMSITFDGPAERPHSAPGEET